VLVLEHAMRGLGQIAELASISRPDIAVIVNIGPVHLELLGSIEAIAAAKAELIEALEPGGTAVVPAGERLLDPYLREEIEVTTFGPSGDVRLTSSDGERVEVDLAGRTVELEVPFTQAHLRENLLAAVAAAGAAGVTPSGRVEVAFSPSRGQRVALPSGVTLIDDCYNANPMSMTAALDDLIETAKRADGSRSVAVLGDMLELGPAERDFHAEMGRHADAVGVDVLVTVGPLAASIAEGFAGEVYPVADAGEAAALVPELLEPHDVVLVKASRGVGLELVSESLIESGG
jgi:UDP-N-acetylmuramoyl-tripeptide--D-alanyl-D-alanine ligase